MYLGGICGSINGLRLRGLMWDCAISIRTLSFGLGMEFERFPLTFLSSFF